MADGPHFVDGRVPHLQVARTAPETGTIARTLGRLGYGEENYMLAMWPPAGARWPAVNPGGARCKDKQAVKARVPRQHHLPFVVPKLMSTLLVIHFLNHPHFHFR